MVRVAWASRVSLFWLCVGHECAIFLLELAEAIHRAPARPITATAGQDSTLVAALQAPPLEWVMNNRVFDTR